MKPLIFQFMENGIGEKLDISLLDYDEQLNLSVDKYSKHPAINSLSLGTMTVTDVSGESSDSDRNNSNVKLLIGTETRTNSNEENSDSDRDNVALEFLMGTMTRTASGESSDSD